MKKRQRNIEINVNNNDHSKDRTNEDTDTIDNDKDVDDNNKKNENDEVDINDNDDDDGDDDEEDDGNDAIGEENEGETLEETTEEDHNTRTLSKNKKTRTTTTTSSLTQKKQSLSIQKAMDYNTQMSQRGIIYVARIPPHMTPMKMKHLLSQVSGSTTVTRIFCQVDPSSQKRKGPKRYIEGWVEFDNKQMAKQIAASLHQQRISNIKRNVHYDDTWCMKYLGSQFTWNHLTEKVAYERRIREQQLRLETMHDQKQIQHYQQAYTTQTHIQQRIMGQTNPSTKKFKKDTNHHE